MELWEIVGVIILAGPLIFTSLCVAIVMIRSGIEELLNKAPKPVHRMEMGLLPYIQDVKALLDTLHSK